MRFTHSLCGDAGTRPAHPMVRSTYHSQKSRCITTRCMRRLPTPYIRIASPRVCASHFTDRLVQSDAGDEAQFDDPVVRQVAVDALGHLNGSVLAVDPRQWPRADHGESEAGVFAGIRTLLHHQAGDRHGRVAEGPDQSRFDAARRRPHVHGPDGSAGAFQQHILRAAWRSSLGFDTVHQYASLFGLGEKAGYGLDRRKRRHVAFRTARNMAAWRACPVSAREFASPAAAGRHDLRRRQRRHHVLPAISAKPRRR